MKLLILGLGYTGRVVAAYMRGLGWEVRGTSRSAESGLIQWPGSDISATLDWASHILMSAAPGENGDPFLAGLEAQILAAKPTWLGYLSTTGVYGDQGGAWVDEAAPLSPATTRGHHRVAAENQWMELHNAHSLPVHIFRLAGIYGPNRGPFAKVRNGTARRIIKENQVFSRIHVEDIAQTIAASIAEPNPGQIYNVCDNDAAPPQDVIGYAATLLGLPMPPALDFETADLTPMARSFYAESKRVSNARIKDELGVQLRYPDYKSGLKALLAQERADG
ncbi:MAG: SDR family oxidoreductase [Rhodobacteraceae bacterium]|nr:SDR family oxidoreductase [Paracoccaceae bacterium]